MLEFTIRVFEFRPEVMPLTYPELAETEMVLLEIIAEAS
jgi:hypothetical protein